MQEHDLKDSDAENAGNMIEHSDKKESTDILGQLMNGASYMIPFVVVGGLLADVVEGPVQGAAAVGEGALGAGGQSVARAGGNC